MLTLLSRLREKGYVAADRRETAHLFRAVVTREELLGSSLTALAERVCDGTASPLVLALVKRPAILGRTRSPISAELLDDLEANQKNPRT